MSIDVEVSHAPTLNFAMEQAGVPVVTAARITNRGATTLDGLELLIGIQPDLVDSKAHAVGRLRPGESVELGSLDLQLRPGRLRSVLEAERAELTWELRSPTESGPSDRRPIEVLAYNQWAGLRAPPALLATFVTPNEPVIAGVLRRVRDRLRENTGDPALSGYQTRSPERVLTMVVALYETLQSFGLSYIGVPASFEDSGQKVRLAEMVLREALGNCLDISVLVASCLEQMGLSPVIAVQKGHAFPGVWLLDERFHEGVVYDAARLRTVKALGNLAFFDSSAMVQEPRLTFDDAQQIATDALTEDAEFLCAIDIPVARRDRYRPLPLRDRIERQSAPPRAGASDVIKTLLDEAAAAAVNAPTSTPISPVANAAKDGVAPAAVNDRFKKWQEKLLDVSLRNKLLNFRRDAKGSLPLDVTDIARLEDLLSDEQAFEIHPKPTDRLDERDRKLVRAHGGDDTRMAGLEEDLGKGIIHCAFDETTMVKHAIHLDREARSAMEEGGANVLYVAIGVLKWFESPSSTTERIAPLLLVPVQLEYTRNTRRVRLRHRPEESLPNWTLIEKMRSDFGVDLSALGKVEPDDSGLDVPAMLHGVREAIQRVERWEVLEEAHLGLFSFTKHLMWQDLKDNADVLLENEVIRHIAAREAKAFRVQGESVAPARLDDEVHPGQLALVVDADSTQTAAVLAGLRGRSFVLQGPPGTGKSQTITNLIAAALVQNKTVLFVSEKMAALEVVYRRLQAVGLGDFCLELHSHKAQKREVVQSLGSTLDRTDRVRRPRWDELSNDLSGLRDSLNGYTRALHAETTLGLSFHQASARLIALSDAPDVRVSPARPVTREMLRSALLVAASFGLAATQVEPVAAHPFRTCVVEGWSAQRDQEARDALEHASLAVDAVTSARAAFLTSIALDGAFGLRELAQLAELTEALAAGPLPLSWKDDGAWVHLKAQVDTWRLATEDEARRRGDLAHRWKDDIFRADLADLVPLFQKWSTAFFLLAWIFLYGAKKRLAALAATSIPGNRQIAEDLAHARESNEAEQAIAAAHRTLRRTLEGCGPVETPPDIDTILARAEVVRAAKRRANGPETDRVVDTITAAEDSNQRAEYGAKAKQLRAAVTTYRDAADRLKKTLGTTEWPDEGPRHIAEARGLIDGWRTHFAAYRPWCLYQRARHEVVDAGFAAVADAHAAGKLRGVESERTLERALLHGWVLGTRDATPLLRDFDGKKHHDAVARFRSNDKAHVTNARAHAAGVLEDRLPKTGTDVGASSEPGILRREMAKKTRHMPLRKLLQQVPNLLVRLKPCLLMSPLSVAQYLPARGRKFDLVVFDEASQICTHDAIGAIGRGAQVVVVGDSKQLPPTAFFQRAASEEETSTDENDFTELESILEEALASGLPEQMLGWHYRSRHEALIQFSNEKYYENRLNVFPAARGRVPDLGVKFHLVPDGFYESGKSRTNPREARALVDLLVGMLRTTKPSERSFGIVTFSAAQQEHINDLLEEARKQYREIEAHFADDHPTLEKVFVKNLENVQGDERDEILFSIAYGPDEHGKMLMNFGPLNRDGGERRLNVAVTRARKQLRVFSSIGAEKIDTNRTQATGARHLKDFLRFAAEQNASAMPTAEETSGDFDSDFERDVFDALRANGHRVGTQVGCGAYRIDLAVVHPEQPGVFVLGVECDGAAYHSGATARDRDRLRQEVLEGLGWRLHRIWSTDWIYNRAAELERLLQAIEVAVREGPPAIEVQAVAAPTVDVASESTAELPEARGGGAAASPVIAYVRAEIPAVSTDSEALYQVTRNGELRQVVAAVLEVEAPLHIDDLARRVSSAFGVQRMTPRVRRRILDVVHALPGYLVVEDFVWSGAVRRNSDIPVRTGADRDAEMVPAEEIAAAARWILARGLSMPVSALVRETAKVFGMRLGSKVEARMRVGVDLLVADALCRRDGELAVWTGDA